MALKERDYRNMRETERVWDAVELNSTNVKDYHLKHVIGVSWRYSDYIESHHLVTIEMGKESFTGEMVAIKKGVSELVERQDEHDWLPRGRVIITSHNSRTKPMVIDTSRVNWECLRDHVARVTIGECTSIIDLEELLKATRYA